MQDLLTGRVRVPERMANGEARMANGEERVANGGGEG